MKLTQLRYFLEICRQKNVTKAAKALHITQPTVSTAIRELEKEFGVDLFLRTNKGLVLTKEGEIFQGYADEVLQLTDRVVRSMKALGDNRGAVKIGIPPTLGFTLFPHIFSSFKERSSIQIEISEHNPREIPELLEKGSLDMAITIINDLPGQGLNRMSIMETDIRFFTCKENPFSRRGSIRIELLAEEPVILYNEGAYINQVITAAFEQAGLKPRVVLKTDQDSTIHTFVLNNIASAFVLHELYSDSDLTAAIPIDPPLPVKIGLIWKKDARLHADAKAFIRFIKERTK